jgi:xylulose-5-phosphate/fructose-6-phosphate phosphoketolase
VANVGAIRKDKENRSMPVDQLEKKRSAQAAGAQPRIAGDPLPPDLLKKIDAYWRAANYLSVGQIYLFDNPLLREPLKPEHIKAMLLGHWGTTPGQNFI